MKLKNYKERMDAIPEEVKREVVHNLDILDRIHELLLLKFNGKQNLLAKKMGKSEAEISKWINGNQNFTIRTISKLEAAFGEPILAICSTQDESTFEQVALPFNKLQTTVIVTEDGLSEIDATSFKKVQIKANKSVTNHFVS